MDVKSCSLLGLGIAAALMAAPSALADPVAPAPPAPVVAAAAEVPPPSPPGPAPDPLAFLRPPAPAAPAPAAPAEPAVAPAEPAVAPAEPAAAPLPAPPDEVPHLISPENLPPGYTMDPTAKSTENPRLTYLRDLWQGVQNQEISAREALIWGLAQQDMNSPYPKQMPGPNVPVAPVDPAAVPPAPALPPPPAPAPAPPPLAPAP
jgi:hypothetical protein